MSFAQQFNEFFLGSASQSVLPDNVIQSIAEQQRTSEKLISWILLIIVCFIMGLYLISPKPQPIDINFELVIATIAIYILFAFTRLFLSYTIHLTPRILLTSAVADVILFLTVIFSFHIMYEQPAYFYLKLPFQQYIYVLLALRTLCFEAKYVITVGVTAALGWLLLLSYALFSTPAGTVTRNFQIYLTSYHIYIVAEINKAITILIVTLILALAVSRARRLLIRSIAEATATKELSKFFEPEIAVNIIQANDDIKPGYGEQRQAAILHCDIRGFSEISKHTLPGELMKLLTQYQSKMVKIILANHGNIDKFLGDGILASFNALSKNENYVADALRAAIAMTDENDLWAMERNQSGLEPFRLGVTIVSGEITVGVVGDVSHMEYTVIGDPVNLSAKLDRFCKIEGCQVVTTEDTFKMGMQQGFISPHPIEQLHSREVEGVSTPVNLVILKR